MVPSLLGRALSTEVVGATFGDARLSKRLEGQVGILDSMGVELRLDGSPTDLELHFVMIPWEKHVIRPDVPFDVLVAMPRKIPSGPLRGRLLKKHGLVVFEIASGHLYSLGALGLAADR